MKTGLRVIALSSALSLAAITTPTMLGITTVGAQDQDHQDYSQQSHQDYSNNRYYKVGKKEGYQDYQHKTQRKVHGHKYRGDDDRRAHDHGYQQGWQGQRYDSDHYHNNLH
jgi:hypothetical protein